MYKDWSWSCFWWEVFEKNINFVNNFIKANVKSHANLKLLSTLKEIFILLLPQSAIFGFLEADDKVFLIVNNLLLLFRYYVYVWRTSKLLSFEALLWSFIKTYKLEKTLKSKWWKEKKTMNKKMENNSAKFVKVQSLWLLFFVSTK